MARDRSRAGGTTETAAHGSPDRTAEAVVVVFLLLVCALPAFAGWSAAHVLGWGAFFTFFVFLPGFACLKWLDPERDVLSASFLAILTGIACLTFVFVASCALDERKAVWIVPVLGAIAWISARRRAGSRMRRGLTRIEALAVLLPIAAALTRVDLESPADWYRGFESDASFHVENAAELRWRWPMADPRIAGEPLHYHFLSYAPSAAASVVLGLPVRECMLGLGAHLLPLLFALGIYAGARSMRAGPWVSALLSLALVLHVDLGSAYKLVFEKDMSFPSPFDVGLYRSFTTAQGMCLLIALAMVLRDVVDGPTRARLVLLAALGALASGSKGSVMPPLLAGMAAVLAWKRLTSRPISPGLLRGFAALTAAALPFTLWLTLDASGYAQTMFKWHLSAAQALSPFQWNVVELCGGDPLSPSRWLTVALIPAWLVGFLGAGTLALWAWIASHERMRDDVESVCLGTACAGMALALLFGADGYSQLFFAYDAQICLILLGAAGLARLHAARRRVFRVIMALLIACLAVQLASGIELRAREPRLECDFKGDVQGYLDTLAWIRRETPPDAVFLIDDPRSGFGLWSERRAFLETARFSARLHEQFTIKDGQAWSPKDDPFLDRRRLLGDFFFEPQAETLREIRATIGGSAPIYAFRSNLNVQPLPTGYSCEFLPLPAKDSFGRDVGVKLVHDGSNSAVYLLPN